MKTLLLFITLLAWVVLLWSGVRLVVLTFWPPRSPLIHAAEMIGEDPVGRAQIRAGLGFIVCAVWLTAYYLT